MANLCGSADGEDGVVMVGVTFRRNPAGVLIDYGEHVNKVQG